MNDITWINNKEYPSLAEGCLKNNLNYNSIRVQRSKKGNSFTVKKKEIKEYKIEILPALDKE